MNLNPEPTPATVTASVNPPDISCQLQLYRLCSPLLPIGSFTWSQGLETAVDKGWIHDKETALDWIRAVLLQAVAPTEGAVLVRLLKALQRQDSEDFNNWNQLLQALRETMELHKEDQEQGELLHNLNLLHFPELPNLIDDYTLVAAFAEALFSIGTHLQDGVQAFLWMWVETQVVQTIKLVPLGLKDGQMLLKQLLAAIPEALQKSLQCPDHFVGLSLPGRSLASAFHETQYCRIYRS